MQPSGARALLAFACLIVMAIGCFCTSPSQDPSSKVPSTCDTQQPVVEAQKLDILFVVDNSGSMKEEQEAVARELTAFVEEVRKGGGVRQDFNIGVITTAVYQHTLVNGVRGYLEYLSQAGKLQAVPDRSADGGVLLGTGAERVLSGLDPDLIDKFSRLVQVGIKGSGQETPFEAIRLALMSELAAKPLAEGGNGGFLRDRARLLVVIVTDEDDCSEINRPPVVYLGDKPDRDYCTEQGNSLTTTSEYHRRFTEELKDGTGATREMVWAVIGPVGRATKQAQAVMEAGQVRNIDCPTSFQPGFRHRQMAERFDPSLANLDSICKPSYRETLEAIAGLANISQTLEVRNVPDPKLLRVKIIRRDGAVQSCTLSNSGLTAYDEPAQDQPARIHFGNQCLRRADDQEVRIQMLCAT